MQMRLMQSFLIMNHYKSLVVLKLPQHKVQLNYFNTYLKKGFINLASILLCIVYRERVHHFFLLILQYENYKKMSLIFLQTFMYVDLICHPLQKIACAKIMKFFTMNQGGIFHSWSSKYPCWYWCSVYK